MRTSFDLSIYFIIDPHTCGDKNFVDITLAAIKGGVTMVQYRNKVDAKATIALHAAELSEHLKPLGIPFLVNDHADIARDVYADGAHIGQGDIKPEDARKILGEDKIIGLTAFTEEHIKSINPKVVDYIGTGPFYPTKTDKGKPVLGAERFAELAALSPVPVVGIGGVTPDNAQDVLEAGADGVAMMRSISASDDPEVAARAFTKLS